jgi:hypothetical protein
MSRGKVSSGPELDGKKPLGSHEQIGFIRWLSVGASRSVFTDVEPGSGAVERRVEGLPLMTRVWFHAMGPTLG